MFIVEGGKDNSVWWVHLFPCSAILVLHYCNTCQSHELVNISQIPVFVAQKQKITQIRTCSKN